MDYSIKPKMILFDVGGTLFDDGKCCPVEGFAELRKLADEPAITDDATLASLWDEYLNEVGTGLRSASGYPLDIPLSAIIKYATMKTGLHISLPMAQQEEIFDRYNSSRAVTDGIPQLLSTLGALGIRTAIISNNAMSGESLALSIKHWIPDADFEFCLTSADLLFAKPTPSIFDAAVSYARLSPSDCWYCGDGFIPDVGGAKASGLTPVFYDRRSPVPYEIRTDDKHGEYLAINHWNQLKDHLLRL